MSKNKNQQGGLGCISFLSLLSIVFIVMKLCSIITWPWLWVLAPIWIPTLFFAVVLVIAVLSN